MIIVKTIQIYRGFFPKTLAYLKISENLILLIYSYKDKIFVDNYNILNNGVTWNKTKSKEILTYKGDTLAFTCGNVILLQKKQDESKDKNELNIFEVKMEN